MTYLFSSNVEVSNDQGNALPISVINTNGAIVSNTNPLPVTIGSDTITIVGNITIPETVQVYSNISDPIHNHITEIGTNDLVANNYSYMPIGGNVRVDSGNIAVYGNIAGITSLPAISGNVHIYGNVGIDGNVNVNPLSATVTGNIGVLNTNGNIVSTANPFPVTGNINATIVGNVSIVNPANTATQVKYITSTTNTQLTTMGQLRIAPAGQQWWYVSSIDKDGDLRYTEQFTGNAAASLWIQYQAAVAITSGFDYSANTAITGRAIRASRRRHKMRPGVSHQWMAVANFDGVQPNTVKQIGMFTTFNGMLFEVTDDLYVVVRRRLIDGTLVEARVKRENFNNDKLNGHGESGYDLNPANVVVHNLLSHVSTANVTAGMTTVYNVVYTVANAAAVAETVVLGSKVNVTGVTPITYNNCPMVANINVTANTVTLTHVSYPGVFSTMSAAQMSHTGLNNAYAWFFDFNGARTNNVRFCLQGPVGPVVLHTFEFGSTLGQQYESAPSLMERAEIWNTGAVSHLPTITISGTSFNVEAESELNPGFGVARNNTHLLYDKNSTPEYAVLGFGLRAGEPYQRADLQLQSIQIIDIANINPQNSGVFYWRILLNPTITAGDVTASNIGKASREWAYTTSTTWTGGIELMAGYTTQSSQIDVRTALNFLNLGSNIAYTDADKIVLVVKQLVGGVSDAKVVASVNIIEAL